MQASIYVLYYFIDFPVDDEQLEQDKFPIQCQPLFRLNITDSIRL